MDLKYGSIYPIIGVEKLHVEPVKVEKIEWRFVE